MTTVALLCYGINIPTTAVHKMTRSQEDIDFDLEFQRDFEDSVIAEELDPGTIPGELFAEFELSSKSHEPVATNLISDDIWASDRSFRKID